MLFTRQCEDMWLRDVGFACLSDRDDGTNFSFARPPGKNFRCSLQQLSLMSPLAEQQLHSSQLPRMAVGGTLPGFYTPSGKEPNIFRSSPESGINFITPLTDRRATTYK
jgi:hypothetical protein